MAAETVLYILIALAVSVALSLFMYGYRSGYSKNLRWILGSLRWAALMALFLLLINPEFRSQTYTTQRPKLAVVVDASASMDHLQQGGLTRDALSDLRSNTELQDKFELEAYSFSDQLNALDSLDFDGRESRIDRALSSMDELMDRPDLPVILLTDGNQTYGRDYQFMGPDLQQRVYPLIAGDSITNTDLRIDRLNTNRYSFLNNQFPVEAVLVYQGNDEVDTRFRIQQGGQTIYQEELRFGPDSRSRILEFRLPSSRVGLQQYQAVLEPVAGEQNTDNNKQYFAVEVIDEATDVLLISEIQHPDLGALKRSIETNEQRKASILRPTEALERLPESELVILYQPRRSFTRIFRELDRLEQNYLIITGVQTDWNFLNNVQPDFLKETTRQREDVTAVLNPNFGAYAQEDIGFEDLPPLKTAFGELYLDGAHEVLLAQAVDGFLSEAPMMATTETNGIRRAIWDGEGFWRWRARNFLERDSFVDFDRFIGQMVQYLAASQTRSRLEVQAESFYYSNAPIQIRAQYFDKNYVFDGRGQLTISLLREEDQSRRDFPLILRGNYYQVDLPNLEAGIYTYTVRVADQAVARSGQFTLLPFDLEQQFLNADVTKLRRLATDTGGRTYYLNQTDDLIEDLVADTRYQAIQREHEKVVPLIDWIYLLGILAAALSAEWFVRKYNGLV